MYSPADISAVMALQQQQQQQLEEAEEMQARALKRPRLVWSPQLHKVFEEAVQKIGINKAVPKTIMQVRMTAEAVCALGQFAGGKIIISSSAGCWQSSLSVFPYGVS
jgi:SHAQKYF class myb-like DNA-binding protein